MGGVSLLQALAQLLAAAALFSSPLRVPRRALTGLWHTLRCLYATQSVLTLLQLGMALQLDPSFKHSLFFAHRVVWCVNAIAGAVVLTARRRRRIQASIARALLPEDRSGLAAVGALMGGKTSAAAFGPSAQCRGWRADGSGSSRSERRAGAATDGSVDGRGRVARVCRFLRRFLSPAPAERRRGEGGGVEAMMCRQASGTSTRVEVNGHAKGPHLATKRLKDRKKGEEEWG